MRVLRLLIGQFSSPLVLMLLVAAGISLAVGSLEDAFIILGIVLLSGVLGFYQEHQATRAVERLLKTVQVRPSVRRGGRVVQVPTDEVVVGDILVLSAGALVAADARVLSSRDLYVDEAALTGESFPVEKQEGEVRADAPPSERRSALFMGTHVVSGTAEALVVATGKNSAFGTIAQHLSDRRRPTDFEQGVQHFGYLLVRITVVLVLVIFALHMFVHRPVLESFLFALALAVGLVPELLPVIVSITLAQGARRMAEAKVIVKRLAAIENFGSMDILCSDKTGTLTEGRARVRDAVDGRGQPHPRTLQLAAWNAALELGLSNPIDDAIRARLPVDPATVHKLDELPYDFLRRRMSVLADVGGERLLITKGAVNSLLPICSRVELADGSSCPMEEQHAALMATFERLSAQGLRTLAVASRAFPGRERVGKEEEVDLVFSGFLVLEDPPREDSVETVAQLKKLGIQLKIITGDNPAVGAAVATLVGLNNPVVLTGVELRQLSPEALVQRAGRVDVFAEVEPMQKERIILALRKGGHVVGYVGDGINDAPALQAADVGISVQSAVDVAREAADLVMLEPNLRVLVEAVQQGRRTFENTLKYVYITTSANFGNMLSMAVAAVFLPFLPLLPKQILLNNFLSDFPAMTIGNDRVASGPFPLAFEV
ncbi:MAG TPA: magnesium-translocating P-type ATPase, partial [Myxococcota bacterium]|nr:magnesium-translocating P-type ATPase [Myxococcota bacterium]